MKLTRAVNWELGHWEVVTAEGLDSAVLTANCGNDSADVGARGEPVDAQQGHKAVVGPGNRDP